MNFDHKSSVGTNGVETINDPEGRDEKKVEALCSKMRILAKQLPITGHGSKIFRLPVSNDFGIAKPLIVEIESVSNRADDAHGERVFKISVTSEYTPEEYAKIVQKEGGQSKISEKYALTVSGYVISFEIAEDGSLKHPNFSDAIVHSTFQASRGSDHYRSSGKPISSDVPVTAITNSAILEIPSMADMQKLITYAIQSPGQSLEDLKRRMDDIHNYK